VTGVASLGFLIHKLPEFLRVSREGDLPFLVEDSDFADAGLVANRIDDLEDFFALVAGIE